jgi:Catalase
MASIQRLNAVHFNPAGNFPEWQLCIQTMDPEQEDSLDFDPLDSTKIWPEVGPLVTSPGCKQTLPEHCLLRHCSFFLPWRCSPAESPGVCMRPACGLDHADCGVARLAHAHALATLAGAVPTAASRQDGVDTQRGQLVLGEQLKKTDKTTTAFWDLMCVSRQFFDVVRRTRWWHSIPEIKFPAWLHLTTSCCSRASFRTRTHSAIGAA